MAKAFMMMRDDGDKQNAILQGKVRDLSSELEATKVVRDLSLSSMFARTDEDAQ